MTKTNQTGFSIVELLLVLVAVGILGFTGWYVYHAQRASSTDYSSAASTTVPTYKKKKTETKAVTTASLKAGMLKYEQISYNYPSNWTVTDKSIASTLKDGCVTPGSDDLTLTSPSDHTVVLHTGIDCIGDGGAKAYDSLPMNILDQASYLDIENVPPGLDSSATGPSYACLSQTTTADKGVFFGDSKHITSDSSSPINQFCYYPYDLTVASSTGSEPPITTSAAMEATPDFKTAVQIFESTTPPQAAGYERSQLTITR